MFDTLEERIRRTSGARSGTRRVLGYATVLLITAGLFGALVLLLE
jgi:hypothetical protein